jgi:rhodanese-related sulfurtransferase
MVPEISVQELAEKLRGATPPLVIDVREPHEYAYCRINGAVLKPLGQIATWARDLDPQAEIVLQCHTGVRSWQAAAYLQRLGFQHVTNLTGGIEAWSLHVDPNVPRY